uniref:Putative lipoprotein n=1 Tax=Desulfovibrio sp. U5L TaxID=596152 RepID=I2PY31_9BACT
MKHFPFSSSRRRLASALFAAMAVLSVLVGCAGQQATVTPSVVVEKETLGRGVEVAIKVTDARPSAEVGLCNPASSFAGKLTTACDPAPAMRSAVERGLRDKGFTPTVAHESVVRSLTVELRELSYKPAQEGGQLAARAVAVIGVTADNNGQVMTRRYEGETVWKLPGEGVEPEFDKLLSMTVSKALSRMASDYELIHFLEKTILRTRDIK